MIFFFLKSYISQFHMLLNSLKESIYFENYTMNRSIESGVNFKHQQLFIFELQKKIENRFSRKLLMCNK